MGNKEKMNSPYAIIVTSNKGYLPGLNILLNGLDYYGNTADVHIIYDGIEEYIQENINKFPFSIFAVDIKTMPIEVSHKFSKYWYMSNIKNNYKVICALGADTAVVDNIMKYFEIAEKTDIIPVGQYPHTGITLEHYKTMPSEEVIKNYPLADFPIFLNTEKHIDFFEYCWKIQPTIDENDPIKNKELYLINKAFHDTNKIDNILVLPGNLWIADGILYNDDLSIWDIGDKKYLYTSLRHRIKILHNKWWKEGVIAGETKSMNNHFVNSPHIIERALKNLEAMKKVLKVLCEGHKVKIKVKELN